MTTTSAWVESPLQLLSVLEAHHAGRLGERTDVVPRGDVATLGPTVRHLRQLGLPSGLRVLDAATTGRPRAAAPWVVGDVFSGRVQRELALDGSGELVVVDDGRATLHLLDLRVAPAGTPLPRARARVNAARRLLGSEAAARLRRAAQDGRLTVVTAYDVDVALRLQLEGMGVHLRRHRFGWLREQPLPAAPGQPTVVLGSAMVHDGLLRQEPYLRWVRERAEHGPVAYYPHRREASETLGALSGVRHVRVYEPTVPVELSLRGLDAGHSVVSLPSTTATTLRAVLEGRGTQLVVDRVPEAWWTPAAGAAVRMHLGGADLAGTVAA
ncbi:hypothetical protein [Angustibacter aerolatus]